MMGELDDLDKVELLTLNQLISKKNKVEQGYNKNVWPKPFKERDLV